MEKHTNNKIVKMRRKNSRVVKIGGVTLLIAITLFVLMLTPIFDMRHLSVEKTGDKISKGQIKEAVGFSNDKNIFKLKIGASEENLEDLPYVKSATVKRKLPGTVKVKITERKPVAYFDQGGGFVLVDEEGRYLEKLAKAPNNIPKITGGKFKSLQAGQYLKDSDEKSAKVFSVLYEKLKSYNLADRVTELNISDANNMCCTLDKIKKVVIGDGYQLDYKMRMLEAALKEIAPSAEGTVTLTVIGKAIFTPAEEENDN